MYLRSNYSQYDICLDGLWRLTEILSYICIHLLLSSVLLYSCCSSFLYLMWLLPVPAVAPSCTCCSSFLYLLQLLPVAAVALLALLQFLRCACCGMQLLLFLLHTCCSFLNVAVVAPLTYVASVAGSSLFTVDLALCLPLIHLLYCSSCCSTAVAPSVQCT